MIKRVQDKKNFHILIINDSKKRHVIAHCLDMDIAAEGQNEEEAIKELTGLIKTQLEYCLANNILESAFRPAPQEYWDKYYHSQQKEFLRTIRRFPIKRLIPHYELSYA